MVGWYKFFPVSYTPLMISRRIESHWVGKHEQKIQHTWVDAKDMSSSLQKAVIAAEDARFFEHHGFDFDAIHKAMEYNKTHKKKKGASTISQQTAKNVFLWPSRSWIRKAFEAYFTFLIELAWSKERIMEVYLNVIEIGPGTYGVEAAAKKYFKKSAKQISASEAALIASVLPNPLKWNVAVPGPYVQRRSGRILARMSVISRGRSDSPKLGTPAKEVVEQTQVLDQDLDLDLDQTNSQPNDPDTSPMPSDDPNEY